MSNPSPEAKDPNAGLPSASRSIRRLMRVAYEAEPRLLFLSFALVVSSWIPDALGPLWLRLLAQGVSQQQSRSIMIGAIGLAASVTGGWLLRTVGGRLSMRFSDLVTVALEGHVAHLQTIITGVEHHERPEHLDRLQMLRDQVFFLNHLYPALFQTIGAVLRVGVTTALLVSIHPVLALLAAFAVPTIQVINWQAGKERAVQEGAESRRRLARHFFDLGTSAGPGKEVRVSGTGPMLLDGRRQAWSEWYAKVGRARWISACWQGAAWALFGAAYVAAVVWVAEGLDRPAGDVLLVLTAGAFLARYLGATVSEIQFLRWTTDTTRRMVWLEDFAAATPVLADQHTPSAITLGIAVEGVSFTYPGTTKAVLDDVTLVLPAGAVVAIVGENGAGKSTLVKLLCRFYEPTHGRITVDGTDLAAVPAPEWRSRIAGAFQDFMRFEFQAAYTIGLGDLPRLDDLRVQTTAAERGGATDVIARLPNGLGTQLGPTWEGGVDLSFGQWQKLALARGLMRDQPLLVVLDEPTAALDAETEHHLFERFTSASRSANSDGRITVLVSHRFSTVRMADLIVVLDGARVAEFGSHDDLMSRSGVYAELYRIQARAYQ